MCTWSAGSRRRACSAASSATLRARWLARTSAVGSTGTYSYASSPMSGGSHATLISRSAEQRSASAIAHSRATSEEGEPSTPTSMSGLAPASGPPPDVPAPAWSVVVRTSLQSCHGAASASAGRLALRAGPSPGRGARRPGAFALPYPAFCTGGALAAGQRGSALLGASGRSGRAGGPRSAFFATRSHSCAQNG